MKSECLLSDCLTVYKPEKCPMISVEISPLSYRYAGNNIYNGVTEEMLSDFENAMLQKQKSYIADNLTSVACKYCAVLIEKILSGECDFYSCFEKLTLFKNYCRTAFPILSELCVKWMFGLALVTSKYTELEYMCADYAFPLAEEYAVYGFINSFLENDSERFRKKLLPSIKILCNFDCEKSPAYIQNGELYENVMAAVVFKFYKEFLQQNGKSCVIPKEKTVKIQAFPGLFCDSKYERQITITYIPYSEKNEMTELLSACVKYTDNLIRQGLEIKSKLVGFVLSPEYRKLIQDTIREEFPGFLPLPQKVGRKPKEKKAQDKQKTDTEYRHTPEPIDLNIDFSKAKKLLADSWKISDMLGADYGTNDISFTVSDTYEPYRQIESNDTECSEEASENINIVQDIPEEWQDFTALLSEDEKKILCLIANGADAVSFVRKRGGMLSGFADSINEKASDTYGDIILQNVGTVFEFIEDYDEELKDIFKDMYNTEVL